MKTTAFLVGTLAVILYCLSYLQKRRKNIIALNLTSRILYVIQYILLGAFEGAVLDIAGGVSSVMAQNKNRGVIKKYTKLFFVLSVVVTVALGMLTYKNFCSLLPVVGVILQTSAFWMDDEKKIRMVSLAGCPFWLVYNFIVGAYSSNIGDVLTIASLVSAVIRYDIMKKSNQKI